MNEEQTKITRQILESVLDSREIDEIQMLLERPVMVEAIKKILLYPIMSRGVLKPGEKPEANRNFFFELVGSQMGRAGMITDEALGQHVRARFEAVNMVCAAFEEMKSLGKVVEKKVEKVNKAV